MQIADTVVVQPDGAAPEVLTTTAAKSWADIAYYFKVLVDLAFMHQASVVASSLSSS